MSKILHFKTHSLLKNLVGKDLINDDNIAIIELVKNSYDAESPDVSIYFGNVSHAVRVPQILIADHGYGMSESDIVDKWLNIAYSEKRDQKMAPGAYLAGNKGIGRFSCDRLGKRLDLITKKADGKLLHLHIDWPDFEQEGNKDLMIQNIGVRLNQMSEIELKELCGLEIFEKGTVLLISDLRSDWDRDKLLALKQGLERFINPNQVFSTSKFKIKLNVPAERSADIGKDYHEKVNGLIQNKIFQNLEFKTTYIQATIDADGATVSSELFHEGTPVFRLTEKNEQYPHLRGVNIVVYYLNPYKKAYFKRQTGIRLIDFGSIFLFLNGFRVAPYGERGDDWLGLDSRKTQGTSRYLSNRDIVGRIEVVDNEDRFKPISSREGLKKTDAFVELKNVFFMDVLRKLEKFVVDGLGWDSIPEDLKQSIRQDEGIDWKMNKEQYVESWDRKRQRIAFEIVSFMGASRDEVLNFWFNPALLEGLHEKRGEEVRALIKTIEEYSPDNIEIDLAKNLGAIKKVIERTEAAARVAKEETSKLRLKLDKQKDEIKSLTKATATYESQSLFLKSIASLDVKNLLGFHHQILLDAAILNNYAVKAVRALNREGGNKQVLKHVHEIMLANKRIMAVAQFATKANFRASTAKELTDIPSFIEQYVLNIASGYVATGLRLNVDNQANAAFRMKISRIELSIVIDNLVSNSVKAHARSFSVIIVEDGNFLTIRFVDDGDGLDKSIKNISDIFDIGVTTSNGSGIGLYHSKEIVESLGGKLVASALSPRGFEIKMELTK